MENWVHQKETKKLKLWGSNGKEPIEAGNFCLIHILTYLVCFFKLFTTSRKRIFLDWPRSTREVAWCTVLDQLTFFLISYSAKISDKDSRNPVNIGFFQNPLLKDSFIGFCCPGPGLIHEKIGMIYVFFFLVMLRKLYAQ